MPGFADVSVLLYAASQQSTIQWLEELSQTFEKLKRRLLKLLIVRLPDIHQYFILKTDASTIAVRAVFKQMLNETKLEHPVEFISRSLTKTKFNNCAYELEMYTVVRKVENFRVFSRQKTSTSDLPHGSGAVTQFRFAPNYKD